MNSQMEKDGLAFELELIKEAIAAATAEQLNKLEFLIRQLRGGEG